MERENETKEELKNKEVQEIKDKIDNNIDIDKIDEMIRNNKLEFEYNKIKYRATIPTFKQKSELNEKKREKFLNLLKDEKNMLEEDLKKIYKKRGIDIDEINQKILALEKQKSDYLLKLGKALKEKSSDNDLEILKNEINKIAGEQTALSIQKMNLLEFSIESQILIYIYSYLAYLIIQKNIDDKWVPAWNTWEEFENSDENLITKASFHAGMVLKNDMEI